MYFIPHSFIWIIHCHVKYQDLLHFISLQDTSALRKWDSLIQVKVEEPVSLQYLLNLQKTKKG